MRVAVIGAGAAGLASAVEFTSRGHEVKLFEQGSDIGGIWAYQSEVEDDLLGLKPSKRVYSSLYENLRTNLPSDLMAFKGFPFDETGGGDSSWPRYPHHTCVKTYLERYVSAHDLSPLIYLNSPVESVKALENGTGWSVQVTGCTEETFDVVAACSGHFSEPRVPDIEGLQTFAGKLLHSHNYRRPEEFANLDVAVLGRGASGADIVQEILPYAREVTWCGFEKSSQKDRLSYQKFPGGVTEIGLLVEGETIQVDALILCTGYRYELPFLDDQVVSIHDNHVSPLYKDILSPDHPTLGVIGLPFLVVPFPLYAMQAKWFAAALDGEFDLPSAEGMHEWCQAREQSLLKLGVLRRHFHRLGEKQGDYYDELAAECGAPLLPEWFGQLVLEAQTIRQANPAEFRDIEMSLPRQVHR